MSQEMVLAGFALLVVALILIIAGSLLDNEKSGKIEWSVGGFIGPIPFGWASSPGMLKWTVLISAVLMIFLVIFLFLR